MNRVARLVGAFVLAAALLAANPVASGAQTTCPAVAPLLNSWQNLTYPSGVSSIFDRIGANKTINYGWGPSNLSGEPSGYGYANFHHGIDTNAVYEKIYAPFSGTAYQISPSGWAGALIIKLVLPNGRYFYFAHLSDQIASGPVKVGDILAVTGNTGYSTGPHLHTQFMEANGAAIPPEQWSCKSGGAGVTAGVTTVSGDFTDDFNRADGPVGNGWTGNGWQVVNNQVVAQRWSNIPLIRPGKSDGYISHKLVAAPISVNKIGIYFRYTDASNHMALEFYSGLNLRRVQAGTSTTIVSGPTSGACANYAVGDVLAVSFAGSTIKGFRNGNLCWTATDGFNAAATGGGILHDWEITLDDYGFKQNTDGTATEASTTPDTTSETESTSSWNPMSWLWDKVKGVLIPSPTEWQEVAAEFATLAEKEPIGTIRDVAGFAASTKALMVAPAGGGAAPSVTGAAGEGLWGWFSFSTVWLSMMDAGQWFASIIEGVTLGSINALQLVKLATDAFLMWGLVLMISRKVHFAA